MSAKQLALTGGDAVVTEAMPSWPVVGEQEETWMTEVVRSGKWSWVGEHEKAFAQEYSDFIGTKYCACLSNGTVTLQCALQAVGVVPGDEVIVPGLTWVATAQAAMDVGANVVLVDVDPATLCLDPAAVEAAITSRTKAIVPVHLYGCMCDMDAIMDIARNHDLKVVEDVAHQHGSCWGNTKAGAIGDAGSYSFQQSKVLTSGEGGAVTTNDAEVYRTVFALKQVGWTVEDPTVDAFGPLVRGMRYAHNYRITEMQCVFLRAGLQRLPEQTRRREANAKRIADALIDMGGPLQVVPRDPRVTTQAYYALTLAFDPAKAHGLTRNQYMDAAKAEGVPLGGTYEPVYRNQLMNLQDATSPIPYRDPGVTQDYANLRLPGVEQAFSETAVTMTQKALLGTDVYIGQLMDGIAKVNGNLAAVAAHFREKASVLSHK